MHICSSKFSTIYANLNSESYHSLIGFHTPEYFVFLKLQVVPRFTGTGTSSILNPEKTKYLLIGTRQQLQNLPTDMCLNFRGETIRPVPSAKDLGLIRDTNMSYDCQYHRISLLLHVQIVTDQPSKQMF